MKIGIITFHFVYNCGAVLQCTALQKALEKMGHEVWIIDYRPRYHQNRYTVFPNPFMAGHYAIQRLKDKQGPVCIVWTFIKTFVRSIAGLRHYRRIKRCDDLFWSFIRQHLNLTGLYRTEKALEKDPPIFNLYISGSDQLWNKYLTNFVFDPAYFLRFADRNARKITYAVSSDFSSVTEPERELVPMFDNLDMVSLREGTWLDYLKRLVPGLPFTQNADPTLLLQREDYMRIIGDLQADQMDYIFLYCVTSNSNRLVAANTAALLKEETGLQIMNGYTKQKSKRPDVANCQIGPREFLAMINNARYVVVSSFHGTMFSIIFEKQFVTIPARDNDPRMKELLGKLGLSDRLVTDPSEGLRVIKQPIDYAKVRQRLQVLREVSLAYLKNNIIFAQGGKWEPIPDEGALLASLRNA